MAYPDQQGPVHVAAAWGWQAEEDGEEEEERRRDPNDGQLYTKGQFLNYYHSFAEWDAAEQASWNPDGGGLLTGKVKNWHPNKGFGFIIADVTGAEIFVHHSDIGGRSLIGGGRVTFDIHTMPDGKEKAVNITGAVGPRMKGAPPSAGAGKGAAGKGKGAAGKGKGAAGATAMGAAAAGATAMGAAAAMGASAEAAAAMGGKGLLPSAPKGGKKGGKGRPIVKVSAMAVDEAPPPEMGMQKIPPPPVLRDEFSSLPVLKEDSTVTHIPDTAMRMVPADSEDVNGGENEPEQPQERAEPQEDEDSEDAAYLAYIAEEEARMAAGAAGVADDAEEEEEPEDAMWGSYMDPAPAPAPMRPKIPLGPPPLLPREGAPPPLLLPRGGAPPPVKEEWLAPNLVAAAAAAAVDLAEEEPVIAPPLPRPKPTCVGTVEEEPQPKKRRSLLPVPLRVPVEYEAPLTTAQVHVWVPPGVDPRWQLEFELVGQTYLTRIPPGTHPGESFVLDITTMTAV
eukprot:TRINITY_DN11874_c0_g1_i1.p1 TRINITY_DN11874_c0_g1~~TRINITY_DN11874_c0_g1_i1.p1  ORF type:complete len:508 (+),score=111.11 TRINITY_DN11874_c0_g1_i1:83-1606(+)